MPRRSKRLLTLLSAFVAGLVLLGLGWVVADWWLAVPIGATAEYVAREECVRCHQQEVDLWQGSDHDLAMAPASPESVLGDFDDHQFVGISFADLARLSDDDVKTVLAATDDAPWALAMHEAVQPLREKITSNMGAPRLAQMDEAAKTLGTVRPCDVTDAQNRIVQVMRQLAVEGKIDAPFAVVSRLFRQGDKYMVETDGPRGDVETFEVKYTFGTWPLQQYLIEFPDGRLQCLGIAWDSVKNEWYHLYPGEPIPHDDILHWTRPLQNWNYMCAECHSTDLQKNYDVAANTYATTWTEIDVGCQMCHGRGSLHVELADSNSLFWDRRIGYGLVNLKSDDSHVEIETCAPCHSRRRVVYPGFTAGDKFLDYYVPELLDRDLYYADGQILDEDYVYGSFIQSLMYQKGVRCSDCHDPHTLRIKYRDPDVPRGQITNNRVCTECHMGAHPEGTYDTPSHHHHPDSSQPGTLCVECHMPETTYMVADPRRDHSMRIPRPDLTIWSRDAEGVREIPNACNGCHHDLSKGETPEWAAAKVEEWYGKRTGPEHFAYAIAAGRQGTSAGEGELEALTRRKDLSAMVRASALVLLGHYGTDRARRTAFRELEDPEGLVRVAAVRALQQPPAQALQQLRQILAIQEQLQLARDAVDPQQRQQILQQLPLPPQEIARIERISEPVRETPELEDYYRKLVPMFRDPIRAVRTEAARVFSRLPLEPLSPEDRKAFDAALDEYLTGQQSLADRADAHMNVAGIYSQLGDPDEAEKEYLAALRLDPDSFGARNNLAMLYAELAGRAEAAGNEPEATQLRAQAEEQFHKAIEAEEKFLAEAREHNVGIAEAEQLLAEGHYSLGLYLAEEESRLADAAEQLGIAAQFAPQDARKHYNYGLALQRLQRDEEAESALRTAYDLAVDQRLPDSVQFLNALTIFYVQRQLWSKAIRCAEEMVRLRPDDPQARAMLQHIRMQSQQGEQHE